MSRIVLEGITKQYPDGTTAVRSLQLDVGDGELLVLVGPSGCGKTTALRMIAGLEEATSGTILIDGRPVNDVQPRHRDIAMVFQSYALYPHLSVFDNIAFSLKYRKVAKPEIRRRVEEAARILELEEHLQRKPRQLSGGQRQRVAMGRAIVRQPRAFLMDEPLSNLDAKLRVQMRAEIARLQRALGVTTIYVTHDQTEAMTLGTRVAVMRLGILQQVASPQELYDHPTNLFVAGFIGSPAMNFLSGTLEEGKLRTGLGDMPLSGAQRQAIESAGTARDVIVGVRPEHFEDAALVAPDLLPGGLQFNATIDVIESLGSDKFVYFTQQLGHAANLSELEELARDSGRADTGDTETIVARLDPASRISEGEDARLWIDVRKLQVFDSASGRNLTLGAATGTPGGPAGAEAAGPAKTEVNRAQDPKLANPPRTAGS